MRFLVAILLTVVTTPGGMELVELATHVLAHADLPHHAGADPDGCDEHTCTPLRHQCGCHSPMSAQPTTQQPTPLASRGSVVTPFDFVSIARGRCGEPPPLRPPIV